MAKGVVRGLFSGVLAAGVLAAAGHVMARSIEAITRPSKDVTLSFVHPGRIGKILVKSGQHVKAGQTLARQDDREELAKFKLSEAQAASTIKIDAAEDELKQKKTDLLKIAAAARERAATVYELQHAKLSVDIAKLSLQLTQFAHAQQQLQLAADKIQLRHMQINTPISGTVEKVYVHKGESVNALAKVVRVVSINPLWIHVPVPLRLALHLKLDEPVKLKFSDGTVKTGKLVRIAEVADAASETLGVRVQVANNSHRPAGEHVRVTFPAGPNVADAKPRKP